MTFLAPLALIWALSIPLLIWLWRFSTSRHETRIPSLAPFAHLLRRAPRHRTRVLTSLLFWLQLAALIFLTLSAAEPFIVGPRTRNVLIVVDTSASMAARQGTSTAFDQAKRELHARWLNPLSSERVMLVTTAPIQALTPEPISDRAQLAHVVDQLHVAEVGGNLAVARRLGHVLMGSAPDETVVLTDEPAPLTLDAHVTFRSFGQPMPNVAIVGAESYEPLCQSSEEALERVSVAANSQAIVVIQNFSDQPQTVHVSASAGARVVQRVKVDVPAGGRVPVVLDVPESVTGALGVTLEASRDALEVDDRMWVTRRRPGSVSVVVASARAPFVSKIGQWLDACSGIRWTPMPPGEGRPEADLLITDDPSTAATWSSAVLLVAASPEAASVRLMHWSLDPGHPLSNYLQPLESVAAATVPMAPSQEASEPVMWAIQDGQRVPIAWSSTYSGRRAVTLAVDPSAIPTSNPVLVLLLNSLRWLTSSTDVATTGSTLIAGPFGAGMVIVHRPDGRVITSTHPGGLFQYDAVDHAGPYRISQGATHVDRDVNFIDPVESNTWTRASSWESDAHVANEPAGMRQPSRMSLTMLGVIAVLVLLLVEWWRYSRKGTRT